VHAADRAVVPLARDDRRTRFRETTWDDTIPALAERLRVIRAEHGPEALGFYISGQLLTEDYYAFNKLAKGVLGTNNLDSNSRLCMSSAVAGYTGAFGSDGPPPSYADIDEADCFLLLGTNTAACHPIVWKRIAERRAAGAFVICVDPRATRTALGSDLHLPLRPGTDLALMNALLHVIARDGLVDRELVAAQTTGSEETFAAAQDWTPERAGEVCGVEAAAIELAARRFATAPAAMALWSMGANQSAVGTLKNRALINLCLATGQIGRPGAGPLSLTGQPNAMGGRETGGLCHLLPGYRKVEVAEDRAAMEQHWGLVPGAIAPEPGLPAVKLFEAVAAGEVRALWIVATNPVVSMPDAALVRAALERAELVVVQDAFHPTETSAFAHVVLPAAGWPEKDGTMTNSERRVGRVRAALPPPGEALPDWEIAARMGRALGATGFEWGSAAEVYAEYAACTAGRLCDVSDVDYARLDREGSVQWGGDRLYADARYPTPDGRARFCPTPYTEPAEPPTSAYPLTLTTGRVAEHWHTLTRTGKSPVLTADAPEAVCELHPRDAGANGVADGDLVTISSRRGSVRMRATVTEGIPEGTVFTPFHWGALHAKPGAGTVNAATQRTADPTSHQPELKAAAVRIEPARRRSTTRPLRVVVVGTGMSGLEVAEQVRARDEMAEIVLLGEEPVPTYNRVLLSKLFARDCTARDIELRGAAWYARERVDMRVHCPARAVDLERRVVLDGRGGTHPYDRLVIATGSRPFLPPIAGRNQEHVFSFRTQRDVQRISKRARKARHAVVVGGGLLGLEAAAGLRSWGMDVSVVEAAPHLMPQQLDAGGAAMLGRSLARLGLETVTGSGVATIWLDAVQLHNGQRLPAELVVIAAGIKPEVTLARAAGIECGRGIVVDDALRTSAPDVFAVGECAEHRGTVYGLWAPLAEQARAAATALLDEPASFVGHVPATTLKVAGVDVYAGGRAAAVDDEEDELVWSDGRNGVYRKLVLQGERLVGAVLVGDSAGAPGLTSLLRSGADCPRELLAPAGATTITETDDALVCACNTVTRGTLKKAIASGLTTLAQVAEVTRASTGCGSCTRSVEALLADA
jgi:ferredoxin-nitrate reductase